MTTAITPSPPENQICKTITRPAFRQFGGKWDIADWIIAQFPPHITYFEPFGGAFSVGFRKQPASHQIYNDLHFDVFNFFQQLQDHPQALMTAIAASPRTEAEFECCQAPTDDRIESARRYYLSAQWSWIGGGGRWSSGASPSRLEAHTDDLHLWAICDRINQILLWNRNALDIIPVFDNSETLFYIDPPYPHQARGSKDRRHKDPTQAKPRRQYQHEMTDPEHQALAELLKSVRGKVVISGYDCPLYNELYAGWTRLEKEVKTSAKTTAVECLWIKPAAVKRREPASRTKPQPHKSKALRHLEEELEFLKQERDRILQAGIPPKGCWIETSKVPGRPPEWRQAFWRSREAILDGKQNAKVKRRYIGKVGSPAHQEALSAIARRKELARLNSQIQLLESQFD